MARSDGCFGSCPWHRGVGAACSEATADSNPTGGVCGGAQPLFRGGCRGGAAYCGLGPQSGRASLQLGWRTRTIPPCTRASDGPQGPTRRPGRAGSSPLAFNGRAGCRVGGGPDGRSPCHPSGNRISGLPFGWPGTAIGSRSLWTHPLHGMQAESGDGPSGIEGSGWLARPTLWLFGSAQPERKAAVAAWRGST